MQKGITEVLWDEIRDYFFEVKCHGVDREKAFDLWSQYQIRLMDKAAEEKSNV